MATPKAGVYVEVLCAGDRLRARRIELGLTCAMCGWPSETERIKAEMRRHGSIRHARIRNVSNGSHQNVSAVPIAANLSKSPWGCSCAVTKTVGLYPRDARTASTTPC